MPESTHFGVLTGAVRPRPLWHISRPALSAVHAGWLSALRLTDHQRPFWRLSGGLSSFSSDQPFDKIASQAEPFLPCVSAGRVRSVQPCAPWRRSARYRTPPGTDPPHANDASRTPPKWQGRGYCNAGAESGDKFFLGLNLLASCAFKILQFIFPFFYL